MRTGRGPSSRGWAARLFGRGAPPAPAPIPEAAPLEADSRPNVTLIAPFIEGQSWCDEVRLNPAITDDDEASTICTTLGRSGAPGIARILDDLGPRTSPSGRFELGYTLIIPLLRFFVRGQDGWEIDRRAIDVALSTLADIDRPAVLHLAATHFSFEGRALAEELGENPRNLMWTKHGPLGSKAYFNTPVFAWTLVDEDAPINRRRREAFEAVLEQVASLPDEVRARIRAVSFLGETHQLFPDLEGAGAGYGSPFDITDYSPAAKRGFRRWLEARFETLDALNEALGAAYAGFEEIEPPVDDLKDDVEPERLRHLDEHAAGHLPIIGWCGRQGGRPLEIDIYVDGRLTASVIADLNRLDVLDARPEFGTPNVGFRYDLDYAGLTSGPHTVAVFARGGQGRPYRLGERTILVDTAERPSTGAASPASLPTARAIDAGVAGVVDRPTAGLTLLYNPLARLWMEYREDQVLRFQEQFSRIALRCGVPQDKVFCHQIPPELYPDYNPEKISVDASLKSNELYSPGMSLYGGCAFGDQVFRIKQRLGWKRYGVGEFNPLMALTPSAYIEMFDRHNRAGAVYLAPYYFSNKLQMGDNQITKRLISVDNPYQGSQAFYEAISRLMHEG